MNLKTIDFKKNRQAEYMNIPPPPPPINALVSPLIHAAVSSLFPVIISRL